MTLAQFGLFGTGGFAREIMPVARQTLLRHEALEVESCVYVDREASEPLNGVAVLAQADFLAVPGTRHFNIAIADGTLRRKIAGLCLSQGAKPLSLVAPNATIYDDNEIGEGAILCTHTTITSASRIGRFFHLNIHSYVAHDCVIGDFVTFAPSVCCNGNVVIGDGAYIGTGAILKQGRPDRPLQIGAGAVVGMGAVVTRDVDPGTTVIGNPARVMERK